MYLMKQLPQLPQLFDCILTDPPYGVELGMKPNNQRRNRIQYDSIQDTETIITWVINDVLPRCFSLSKRIVLTPGVKYQRKYPEPNHIGCIYYPAATGCNSWGFSCWQPIFYYGKDPYAGKGSKPDSISSVEQTEINGHPCPKPIGQWSWLLKRVTLPGELVFDPLIGSGTTAVAAKKSGRHFLGFEISEDYCEIANERLANTSIDLLFR